MDITNIRKKRKIAKTFPAILVSSAWHSFLKEATFRAFYHPRCCEGREVNSIYVINRLLSWIINKLSQTSLKSWSELTQCERAPRPRWSYSHILWKFVNLHLCQDNSFVILPYPMKVCELSPLPRWGRWDRRQRRRLRRGGGCRRKLSGSHMSVSWSVNVMKV